MQPYVNTESRFTFRIDFPDLTDSMFVKCGLDDLPTEVGNIITHLGTLTVDEAPMMIEVRRTK